MELGDLAVTVRRFAEMLGWSGEIEELMSAHEAQVGGVHRIGYSLLPAVWDNLGNVSAERPRPDRRPPAGERTGTRQRSR